MNENVKILLIVCLNFILTLVVVYMSPRFDVITMFGFLLTSVILYGLLVLNEKQNAKKRNNEIEELFTLLHSLSLDTRTYEVLDDEFGKLRDEIVKIISENQTLAKKAKDNDILLKEYTEDIAHQLKTPLTGILLMLDLMEEDQEHMNEYLVNVRNSVNRLHKLCDSLLKLAALDSNTIKMNIEPISIRSLIEKLLVEIEVIFKDRNYQVPIIGDDFELMCDEKWTYEAIFNIVKNGMEASKKRNVKIYLKETNLYQSILVEDYSEGISRENLKLVYKRFYKIDKKSKGYGIGLPMAKTIMEKQDGELIYSKMKESNIFELRFYK